VKKLNIVICLTLMVMLSGSLTSHATTYTIKAFIVPGSTATWATGINNHGQVVGYYSGYISGPEGGYTGETVSGFIKTGATFADFNLFGVSYFGGSQVTYPTGINNSGQIVGIYGQWFGPGPPRGPWSTNANTHYPTGFIATIGGGVTSFRVPGSAATHAAGINDSGQVVGNYFSGWWGDAPRYGFIKTGENFADLLTPSSWEPYASESMFPTAINNSGQVVGVTLTTHGFAGFIATNGILTSLQVPGSLSTYPNGINNLGQVVGDYQDKSGMHGFIYAGGTFTTLDFPGPITGINDLGQIVGYSGYGSSGFIATPSAFVPLPFTILLLGSGLL
jgi:probable HAF family extracellular repeat protein